MSADESNKAETCKMCDEDATVLLHGRFPFCPEHYEKVINA